MLSPGPKKLRPELGLYQGPKTVPRPHVSISSPRSAALISKKRVLDEEEEKENADTQGGGAKRRRIAVCRWLVAFSQFEY